MILFCVNELEGNTGYHKAVVETANGLHRAGYAVTVLAFNGSGDGSARMLARKWALDPDVPAFSLHSLAADGGRLLHRNVRPAFAIPWRTSEIVYTENQLAVLRELNGLLTPEDTILFTAPIPALAYQAAIGDDPRRARSVLQIHNDYRFHEDPPLWGILQQIRPVVDRLQTVSSGLREQFLTLFEEDDVVFVPNFPGPSAEVQPVAHDGVNIVLPASFQERKNQLDAVRALDLVGDPDVRLTLWGALNTSNVYLNQVRSLCRSLGLEERVHLPGHGSERDVYGQADIVLMTSLSEGFGYPLLEAAMHGLPVVTYDFDFGPRDIVRDCESGYVVPVGDVDQLAARLRELAHDPELRARMGASARRIYEERFSAAAVARAYRPLLGDPGQHSIDLSTVFDAAGPDPLRGVEITLARRPGPGAAVSLELISPIELHDVVVDDGRSLHPAHVRRVGRKTRIDARGTGVVISYTTAPGSSDRFYLASISEEGQLEVLPYLRRGADYGDGTPRVADSLITNGNGARRLSAAELRRVLPQVTHRARADVAWKVRQLRRKYFASGTTKAWKADQFSTAAPEIQPLSLPDGVKTGVAPADAAAVTADAADAAEAAAGPQLVAASEGAAETPAGTPAETPVAASPAAGTEAPATSPAGGARALLRTASSRLGVVRRAAGAYVHAAGSMVQRLAVQRGEPTSRLVPRHPRFPVTSGVDSFGAPVNAPGGVQVENVGGARQPAVRLRGEYDWVLLRDGKSQRKIGAPYSYGEMFERLCAAERDFGLFEMTTNGVHVWELGRSALVIQLAEAYGLWGPANALGARVLDEYPGRKKLADAPSVDRVVFDYARRGQSDYRTSAFRDAETMFVVQPEPEGYPEVTETNLVYPFQEFNEWKRHASRRLAHQRVPDVDARPFEEALSRALGIKVDLGMHLRNRLLKFTDERDFWAPVFDRLQPREVLIASSHWWAGIAEAAKSSGALVSDIQYALTSRHAPSFWFGDTPRHGATRLYAWSDYWAERTNVYREHVVVPRQQPEFASAGSAQGAEPLWDVCVIAQPRVLRRILAFTERLVRERPGLRVVVAPHPSQRLSIADDLAAVGLTGKVSVASADTLTTIGRSALCVGTFSTSLWEAAALGCPTYVIPVPGYEETLDDVKAGLFRLAQSPDDLVPFDVPAWAGGIFGH